VRYRSTRNDDASLCEKLPELAAQLRRFGYRRLHILLRREGVMINRKMTQRLSQEEGLAVRRRRSRKRAIAAADDVADDMDDGLQRQGFVLA
jgi:putative transposase